MFITSGVNDSVHLFTRVDFGPTMLVVLPLAVAFPELATAPV